MCDATTGWCIHVEPQWWCGDDKSTAEKKKGITAAFPYTGTIAELVAYMVDCATNQGCVKRGTTFYCDRYFTSVTLLEALVQRGHHLVGTIMLGRSGIRESDINHPPGFRYSCKPVNRHCMSFTRNGRGYLLEMWHDRGVVIVLSDLYQGVRASKMQAISMLDEARDKGTRVPVRQCSRGSWDDKATGAYSRKPVPVPESIYSYQKHMNGVDVCDHYRASYTCRRRSRRWYHCLVYFILDIAIVHGYLAMSLCPSTAGRAGSNLQYRLALVDCLRRIATDAATKERDAEDAAATAAVAKDAAAATVVEVAAAGSPAAEASSPSVRHSPAATAAHRNW